MTEVRIPTALAPDANEQDRPRLLIDPQDLGHVSFPGRDPILQLPTREVVQIEMAPIVALRKPQHLIRRPGDIPILAIAPRLEIGRDTLLESVAHGPGVGV